MRVVRFDSDLITYIDYKVLFVSPFYIRVFIIIFRGFAALKRTELELNIGTRSLYLEQVERSVRNPSMS